MGARQPPGTPYAASAWVTKSSSAKLATRPTALAITPPQPADLFGLQLGANMKQAVLTAIQNKYSVPALADIYNTFGAAGGVDAHVALGGWKRGAWAAGRGVFVRGQVAAA